MDDVDGRRLSGMNERLRSRRALRATLLGGAVIAVLDGLDAIVAYRLVLGLDPVTIYQFVASGMLGPEAFSGGVGAALVGVLVHCAVAVAAAGSYAFASARWSVLVGRPAVFGALYGLLVFGAMNYGVIPLSLIPPSPFSLPLFVNGVVGHVLFVGLPAAYVARRYLGSARPGGAHDPQAARAI
jgi:hypothetical protein